MHSQAPPPPGAQQRGRGGEVGGAAPAPNAHTVRSSAPPRFPCARSNGVVESWEDMGRVWDHTFGDVLRVDPAAGGCSIMLTEPPMNPRSNRQRMLEVRAGGWRGPRWA